jgi:hypothetical protein
MYPRKRRDHGAFQLRSDPAVVMLEVRRFFGSANISGTWLVEVWIMRAEVPDLQSYSETPNRVS